MSTVSGPRWFLWMTVLFSLLFAMRELSAEETLSPNSPSLPDAPEVVVTAKWERILEQLPNWSSQGGPNSFHFEVQTIVPLVDIGHFSTVGIIGDHQGIHDAAVYVSGRDPRLVCTAQDIYHFSEGTWEWEPDEWSYQAGETGKNEEIKKAVAASGPLVCNLRQQLQAVTGGKVATIQYDRMTLSDLIVTNDDTSLTIRRRSPNDEELLGTGISEVKILPKRGEGGQWNSRICFRAFNSRNLHGIRFAIDPLQIHRDLTSKTSEVGNDGQPVQKASLAWKCLFPVRHHNIEIRQRLERDIYGSLASLEQRSTLTEDPWTRVRPFVVQQIQSIRLLQRHVLKSNSLTNQHWMDDPVIRWQFSQDACRELVTQWTELLLAMTCQYCGPHDSDLALSYYDAIADLGSSEIPYECVLRPEVLKQYMPGQEDFVNAVFSSRHQWYVTPSEIEACVEALDDSVPGSETDRVSVETLLRLDKFDRIPPDRWQVWWEREVVKADKVSRWDNLSMLSFHPGNRAVLMEQLPKAAAPLNREIYVNLRQRAESTMRTKRWDFMTEEECHKIFALAEPPVPGKDSEDGAARPFPKDELPQ